MADPYIGEIRLFSFNFPPKGWAQCNGQLMPINQNAALFSLLGTMYGGNGTQNFGLPDLQGRVPISFGANAQGTRGGELNHTLTSQEMGIHNHPLGASSLAGGATKVSGADLAMATANVYSNAAPTVTLDPQSITGVGNGGSHNNAMPSLVINFSIALQGIFPSRN